MTADPTTGPLRFAYWVPNVSGGLVTSTIDQRTGWSFDCNRTLARLAERVTMSATSCSTTSCRRTMAALTMTTTDSRVTGADAGGQEPPLVFWRGTYAALGA